MTTEEMKSFARLDDAVDKIAEGRYTVSSKDMPNYNIRAIVAESNRLGRPLTDAEAAKFTIGA